MARDSPCPAPIPRPAGTGPERAQSDRREALGATCWMDSMIVGQGKLSNFWSLARFIQWPDVRAVDKVHVRLPQCLEVPLPCRMSRVSCVDPGEHHDGDADRAERLAHLCQCLVVGDARCELGDVVRACRGHDVAVGNRVRARLSRQARRIPHRQAGQCLLRPPRPHHATPARQPRSPPGHPRPPGRTILVGPLPVRQAQPNEGPNLPAMGYPQGMDIPGPGPA